MDKKTALLLILIATFIALSVFFTYKRSFIDNDFEIINNEVEI